VLLRFDRPASTELQQQAERLPRESTSIFSGSAVESRSSAFLILRGSTAGGPNPGEAAAILFKLQFRPIYSLSQGQGAISGPPRRRLCERRLPAQERKRLQQIQIEIVAR